LEVCLGRSTWRQGGPEEIRIRRRRIVRASRGFSLVEILVVVALIGILAVLAGPVAGKWIRRSEDMAALASVRQVLAVARLEAIKASSNVVVAVGKNSNNTIHLLSFRDKADVTTPSANDGNGKQETGEPTLGDVTLSPRIHLWKQGGSEDNVPGAVLFDTCAGDASSKCIVFLPGGGISLPGSGLATPTGGRGIYFADWQGKNYFRVTVESNLSGKARADKYVQGSIPGYYPASSVTRWSWL
jgi:prepilin-type N-terminal cleavage/methylation domain-containing protein